MNGHLSRITRVPLLHRALILALVALGAARFTSAGFLSATRSLKGDFAAAFPTAYFARFRPDFPVDSVWKGWNYGPMFHYLTLPLLAVPQYRMVPTVWALVNLAALCAIFVLTCRLSGALDRVSWWTITALAGLWLLFQPLTNCFAQGNIEILEMLMILAALEILPRSEYASGALIGAAAMTKLLPIGFLGWFAIRRHWRAVAVGLAVIALVVAIAAVTLDWKNNIFLQRSELVTQGPVAGLHELSITSVFAHAAGLLDEHAPGVRWFPAMRFAEAARAGRIASVLLAVVFGLVLIARRRTPVSPYEVSVLFIAMLMIPPWNHDYYYVFALVPLSVLFLDGVATRNGRVLAGTVIAYVLMSPPVPYGIVDRLHMLPVPFAYAVNYYNLPVFGGLILWVLATHQWLNEGSGPELSSRAWLWRRAAAAALALPILFVGVAALSRSRPADTVSPSTVNLTFAPPIDMAHAPAIAMTRDGLRLAYVGRMADATSLCVRSLEDVHAQCIAGTERAVAPFFSPDGQWLGFYADGELRKIPVHGGAVQTITRTDRADPGSWSDDGWVVFASSAGISRVSEAGGSPELLIPVQESGGEYRWPTLTPNGRAILFTELSSADFASAGTIIGWSFDARKPVWLTLGLQPQIDRSSGALIYSVGGQVVAARFDQNRLQITSTAVPVGPRALLSSNGIAQLAAGSDGTILYAPQGNAPAVRRTLAWVDHRGGVTPIGIAPAAFELPRISPDGRELAVVVRDATTDVWVYDLSTGTSSRATTSSLTNTTPAWRPHANSLWFVTEMRGQSLVSEMAADQLRRGRKPFWKGAGTVRLTSWSADGRLLAGTRSGDLWILRAPDDEADAVVASDGTVGALPAALVFQTTFEEKDPVFSPDGRWLAYTADVPGWDQVYIRAAGGLGDPVRVSEGTTGGGFEPRWSPDGHELFYRTKGYMMAVDVTEEPGPAVRVGTPHPLFRNDYEKGQAGTNYDLSPDGSKFLMVVPPTSFPQDVRVVRGWSASLPK